MLHVDMSTWGDLSEQLNFLVRTFAYHVGTFRPHTPFYLVQLESLESAASRVRPECTHGGMQRSDEK